MLPEALETAYGLLRSGYLAFAWHLLQSAASWQQVEAALYLFTWVMGVGETERDGQLKTRLHCTLCTAASHAACRAAPSKGRAVPTKGSTSTRLRAPRSAVSTSVKGRVLGGGEATDSDGASSAVRQDAQQAQQLLASLFAQLCCEDGVARLVGPGGHPLLACGACGLLESYAAWFGRAQAAPLQEAFRLTLACMRLREVRRVLCSGAPVRLGWRRGQVLAVFPGSGWSI